MLKDYVFISELARKVGVKPAYFYTLKNHRKNSDFFKKLGSHIFIKKSMLPEKYKDAAYNKCTKLDNLLPASYITHIFDLSKDYMSVVKHNKTSKLKIVKVNNTNFVEVDNDLLYKITYMVPFRIRSKEDEQFAEEIFQFGYTKIGFYK